MASPGFSPRERQSRDNKESETFQKLPSGGPAANEGIILLILRRMQQQQQQQQLETVTYLRSGPRYSSSHRVSASVTAYKGKQAACSGKSVPLGYIPSPRLLTGRYCKKERRMSACKQCEAHRHRRAPTQLEVLEREGGVNQILPPSPGSSDCFDGSVRHLS
ncbi:unnamed protein product [Pleuronectes platessa]|uniref:Uncharacterized protein n=1 Tax=Pleuronectes platessa TaxID=8262 RepID=A0A9N7YWR3_PLEPL|nr:unnamed protein product [Pleuronectes platessa]